MSKVDYGEAMKAAGIPEQQATEEYKRDKVKKQIGVGKDYNQLEDRVVKPADYQAVEQADTVVISTTEPAMFNQRVTPVKKRDKVAICGSASSSLKFAPVDDDSIEIWSLAWRQDLPRVDRMFDIHDFDLSSFEARKLPEQYRQYLANVGVPCYLTKPDAAIPNGVPYPIHQVAEFLSKVDDNVDGYYFSSSIGYMLALALFEGYKEIHFYGVDLIDDDEYGFQRPNLEYLIGLARGWGRKVYIPPTSALCKFPYLYGYQHPPAYGPFTKSFFETRIKQYKEKVEGGLNTAHTADGAKQEAEQLLAMLKHEMRGVPLEQKVKHLVQDYGPKQPQGKESE